MREFSEAFEAALADEQLRPVVIFEGQFATGFVRLWSGVGSLEWNGETFAGAGSLLGLGTIDETREVVAGGTAISLSGIDPGLVQACIEEARQGLPGRVWIGLLALDGQLIADPVLAFSGRLDVPELSDDQQECTITISYESRLIDLTVARTWRYTHESQQTLHPGDRAFEYVTSIQDKEITWGRKT
jgi:hypothetical protein